MPTFGINEVSNVRRTRCSCRKYCPTCVSRNLMPAGNEAYAELFPVGVHMGKAVEMPHYDAREDRQWKRWRPDWRERLLAADVIKLEDLRDLVGSNDANASMIVRVLRARGFTFTAVGEADRRLGTRGPVSQLYRVSLAN